MNWLKSLVTKPVRLVVNPIERLVKAKLSSLIDDRLAPISTELKSLHAKMDRILDINLAPEVLSDFRAHNEALRAIQADCDLLRDLNPMFNGFLRDMVRLEMRVEELARSTTGRTSSPTLELHRERESA